MPTIVIEGPVLKFSEIVVEIKLKGVPRLGYSSFDSFPRSRQGKRRAPRTGAHNHWVYTCVRESGSEDIGQEKIKAYGAILPHQQMLTCSVLLARTYDKLNSHFDKI